MRVRELEELRSGEERRSPEPAALPLHAVLALQRSAGNQAVGRVLARQKINKGRLGGIVKQAMAGDPVPADADELLLAMYNKLAGGRLGPWQRVADAKRDLLAATKIDDQDVTAFADAAKGQFGQATGVDKKAAATQQLAAEIQEDRPDVEATFSDHVFLGMWKEDGEPGGYHSIVGNSPTHEAYGKKTALEKGTYQQSVRAQADHTKIKKTQSTFFPDTASKDQVLDAITSVYGRRGQQRGLTTVQYPDTLKGIKLQQISGTTAFPAGGGARTGEGWMSPEEKKKQQKLQS